MFEHSKLDGEWHKVIPAMEPFTKDEILEIRDSISTERDSKAAPRTQYTVVDGRLAERCLPPESIGNSWSFDSWDTPWWGAVNNPPHAGLVADFNSYGGGAYRKALEPDNNVVAFAGAGEPVTFKNGSYSVTRGKDDKVLTAASLLELRKTYYGD